MHSKPLLYLLVGYPGSGKTTTAQFIHELTGAVHLSSDLLRLELFPRPTFSQAEHDAVYKELNARTERFLRDGASVIYDANLNRYEHRAEKYALCETLGIQSRVIWLEVPRARARERAILRGHHHLVPQNETFESMFERVANTIEPPHADEVVTILDGSHVTAQAVAKALAA